MADIVNLRRFRKKTARAGREAEAVGNRIRFGRPKSERARARAVEDLESRRIDAHRLDAGAKEPPAGPPKKR